MKPNITEFEQDHWFFYTSTILNFTHIFHKAEYRKIILESLNYLITNERIHLGAYVIMPNHIHLILKSRDKHKVENINRDFKKYTSQQILLTMKDKKDNLLKNFFVNKRDRKYQIWKREPNLQNIFSPKFLIQKFNYIHNNPCQPHWQLAEKPEEYKYSSASFYLLNKEQNDIGLYDLRRLV